MAKRYRVLHHKEELECEHGGQLTIAAAGQNELAHADEILTDVDLLERATITCTASPPCTKVHVIAEGRAKELLARGGEVPLVSNLIALTDTQAMVIYDNNKALRQMLKSFLLRADIEGDYSNDPADPGGETKKGITWNTWQEVAPQVNVPADHQTFLQMEDAHWDKVFQSAFWDKLNLDKIDHPGVALMTGDFYFNSRAHAVTHLQNLLNTPKYGKSLTPDGGLGNNTVTAINEVDGDELLRDYIKDREQFLANFVRAHPRFRGLLTRTGKLADIILRFVFATPTAPVIMDSPVRPPGDADARVA